MNTFRSHILSWLTVSLLSLLLTACERSANVEFDLQKISQKISQSDSAATSNASKVDPGGGDKDRDDDDPPLSVPTARLIVRSDAILRDFSTSPTSQSSRESKEIRELLARAEAVLHEKGARLQPH